MTALAVSFGFPPLFEAHTDEERKQRRMAWGVIISIALHGLAAVMLWTYRTELQRGFESVALPVSVFDEPFAAPTLTPSAEAADSGGGGAPVSPPALAARETVPPTPPPLVSPYQPAPETTATIPSPVPADTSHGVQPLAGSAVAGTGTGTSVGVGSGAGTGSGVGSGIGAGQGSLGAGGGWHPRWIRLPTPYEARWFYPGGARSKQEGWAVIRCTITETGRAKRCIALGQSSPAFGPAAVAASRYFRITPKEVDGRNVAAELDIRLIFYTD